MGMDIIGQNPKNQTGEYFRNNIWWWRPLFLFCEAEYSSIVGFDATNWQYNSGDGLDEEKSVLLAKLIKNDLKSGRIKQYEQEYREYLASLQRVECYICNATGIRTDKVGIELGQPEKELKPEVKILTGRTHGWCNACDGVGSTENPLSSYPFDADNVREFAEFLEHCGGFSIW